MALIPPNPVGELPGSGLWNDWIEKIRHAVNTTLSGGIAWSQIGDFTGSTLLQLQTRSHQDLQNIDGPVNARGHVNVGGTTGKVLTKLSGSDYDYDWVVAPGAGAGAGTVTHVSGALTDHAVVLGNATDDVKVMASLGTSGQVLTSAGAGANPTWATPPYVQLSTVNVFTKNQSVTPVTLTDGATVTLDASLSNVFELQAGALASRVISNPTNATAGMVIYILFFQDTTGGRAITWGSKFVVSGGAAIPAPAAASNDIDLYAFLYSSTKDKWILLDRPAFAA